MLKFYCLQLMDKTDTLDKTRNRKSKERRKVSMLVCVLWLYIIWQSNTAEDLRGIKTCSLSGLRTVWGHISWFFCEILQWPRLPRQGHVLFVPLTCLHVYKPWWLCLVIWLPLSPLTLPSCQPSLRREDHNSGAGADLINCSHHLTISPG